MYNGTQQKFDIYLNPAPLGYEQEYKILFSEEAINFLVELNLYFQNKVNDLFTARLEKKYLQKKYHTKPKFAKSNILKNWTVAPVNHRLQNRRLDLGDVSPSNYNHFISSLKADVQGIQVDFDDGHCPTWKNQIVGLYNVYRVVHNKIPNVPKIIDAPILMLRPRAWNMTEHNMSINGKKVPGPLFDFGLLMFHNALILSQFDSGPFFYLSKLEGASEAKLWNEIFVWTQWKLHIPYKTIKACVLIENILSTFEMDQILYELRDHSIGLNCGIWDYAASIIAKFGDDASFLLPDRNKYVHMSKPFLKKYMDLLIRTCHNRKAHATGGMAAKLLNVDCTKDKSKIVQSVLDDKMLEIQAGIDGFMVYDLKLVDFINDFWKRHVGLSLNQINNPGTTEIITELDLLTLPKGGVTEEGLRHNISIAILFIYNWLCGKGAFIFKGAIEDSATAEISRSQIWQWIRYGANFENQSKIVTRNLVLHEATNILKYYLNHKEINNTNKRKYTMAFNIFLEIVNHQHFPEFITTYLNDRYIFQQIQAYM